MLRHILTRLILMIPVIFFITVMVFTIMHLIPGDPAYVMLGEEASPKAVETLRKQLGLDRSIPVQYMAWMKAALTSDENGLTPGLSSLRSAANICSLTALNFPLCRFLTLNRRINFWFAWRKLKNKDFKTNTLFKWRFHVSFIC